MLKFSLLIITHGREELLSKCLNSLQIGQEDWQLIIVANGQKLSDQFLTLAKEICQDFTLIYLDETQPPGKVRNCALESMKHDWVFLLDDDAYLPKDYFNKAYNSLLKQNIEVLGGPDTPASNMNAFALALGLTLTSPFCTGFTHLRHLPRKSELRKASEEHLTSCNLWIKKDLLLKVKFPDSFARGEETMLLLNLRKMGIIFYFDPQLYVFHHRRTKLKDLLRPTFNSGFYRSRVMKNQIGLIPSTFWLPAIFVLLHLTCLWNLVAFFEMAKFYIVLVAAMTILIVQRARKPRLFMKVFYLHYVIVFLYGLGFLLERIGFPWKSTQS